jgi:hypothetical protein
VLDCQPGTRCGRYRAFLPPWSLGNHVTRPTGTPPPGARLQAVRERRAPRRTILDDADARVACRLASARGAIIRRLALEVMGPHTPSAVSTCRHLVAPVPTGRHPLPVWGSWRRSPPSALPAAQDVMRRPTAGGHRGPGGALAQNLHSVSPAAALGAKAAAPGGIAASACLGWPHHLVRTDGPQGAMVQADQTVREQKVKVERAYGTERELCSAGLPPADSLHSEPVARPLARLGGGSRWPESKGPVEFLYSQ